MRNTQDIRGLVRQWHGDNPAKRTAAHGENELFRMLYEAYCCRSGEKIRWEQLRTHYDYEDACGRIYGWYTDTYERRFRMPAGGKGQKRVADPDREAYTFHLRYSDQRSFKQYLMDGKHVSGSQTLFSFVLHTAVAFLVPPHQLDLVLQRLGFHPLHVKNIHHLAIYYVLLTSADRAGDHSFNPFDSVRELYFRAHELLAQPGDVPPDTYRYADRLTRMIREELFLRNEIREVNFENLVKLNRDSLNMRHSMILKDFRMLTAVFFHVFDDTLFSPEEPLKPGAGEEHYSLYAFVGRFCRKKLGRRKYREWLSSTINLNQKHPTREMMILLWLYAYCFAFLPEIYMEPGTIRQIRQKLQKVDPARADDMDAWCKRGAIDICGLISGAKNRRVSGEFRGMDFIADINDILMRYGWGPLNATLSFDYYIMKLAPLELELDHSQHFSRCRSIRYAGALLTGVPTEADNVPAPLVAVSWIMHHLKEVQMEKTPDSPCPLECALYEQI